LPIIATGHLSAVGVTTSDSERDIYIGTLDGFSHEGFPPVDYVALGHIHRPQRVAKQEHIRYCGSPIALSFSEINTQKEVLMVTFNAQGLQQITPLPVPCFQPMQVLRGSLDQIERQLQAFPLVTAIAPDAPLTWCCIEVSTDQFLPDLQQRIQQMAEGRAVEVLQLKRMRTQQRQETQVQQASLDEMTPTDVFENRLAQEDFSSEVLQQRRERVREHFRQILSQLDQHEG
jgi:exonuclease SbcD